MRAYVSTVYGCPYEGAVDPGKALELCRALRALGCYQISLGDTIGVANPRQVRDVLSRVLAEIPAADVAVHFHDTRGTALANILVSVEMGITTVDAALGGLGGCPYAPGASGNVATEDVVYMLEGMGVRTGVDLDRLVDCSRLASSLVGHEMPSKYYRAAMGARAALGSRRTGRGADERRRRRQHGPGRAGGVRPAFLTLYRPEAANALSRALVGRPAGRAGRTWRPSPAPRRWC